MWGNHLADRACVQDARDHSTFSHITRLNFPVKAALKALTCEDTLYWADQDGNHTLNNFNEIFDRHLLEKYQENNTPTAVAEHHLTRPNGLDQCGAL